LVSSIPALASNPASVADILAQQMPTASTFFITLLLTQFTGTMGTLLQGITLLLYYVKVLLLGGSPWVLVLLAFGHRRQSGRLIVQALRLQLAVPAPDHFLGHSIPQHHRLRRHQW
jgi:hypothetical protein